MIVQDKLENMEYFGAVQFFEEKANKSLAKYPGVKVITNPVFRNTCWRLNDDEALSDGDWIITDKEGKSEIYSPDEFRHLFDKASEDK